MELDPERRNIWKVENGYILLLEPKQLSPTTQQAPSSPSRPIPTDAEPGGGARIWGRARLGAGGWGEQALKRGPAKLPTGKATLRLAPSWVTGRRNRASKDSLQGLSIQQESLKNVYNVAHKPCTHNFVFLHLHLTSPLVSDPKARPSFHSSSFDAAFSLTCKLEPLGASVSTPMK